MIKKKRRFFSDFFLVEIKFSCFLTFLFSFMNSHLNTHPYNNNMKIPWQNDLLIRWQNSKDSLMRGNVTNWAAGTVPNPEENKVQDTGWSGKIVYFSKNQKFFATSPSPALAFVRAENGHSQ